MALKLEFICPSKIRGKNIYKLGENSYWLLKPGLAKKFNESRFAELMDKAIPYFERYEGFKDECFYRDEQGNCLDKRIENAYKKLVGNFKPASEILEHSPLPHWTQETIEPIDEKHTKFIASTYIDCEYYIMDPDIEKWIHFENISDIHNFVIGEKEALNIII